MYDPLAYSYAEQAIREVKGAEKDDLLLLLKNEWKAGGEFWFPVEITEDDNKPPHTEAFHAPNFEQELSYEPIRQILVSHNITTLFELREEGEMWEIELAEFYPIYTGLETFWFTAQLDWLIYSSHEGTITFSGIWLLPEVQAAWLDWSQYVWIPPCHN